MKALTTGDLENQSAPADKHDRLKVIIVFGLIISAFLAANFYMPAFHHHRPKAPAVEKK